MLLNTITGLKDNGEWVCDNSTPRLPSLVEHYARIALMPDNEIITRNAIKYSERILAELHTATNGDYWKVYHNTNNICEFYNYYMLYKVFFAIYGDFPQTDEDIQYGGY